MKHKYPIGIKIKFIHPDLDTGLAGTFVGCMSGYPLVFLPKSPTKPAVRNGFKYTWMCEYKDFEVLVRKNQQLLFSFMDE